MIAVPHQHSAGVAHDLGRQEQETQSRGRQRDVAQILGLSLFLPVEQHQPTVQVVGQHRQLEVHTVHGPSPRGMRRQARIVVGFFDQVLRPRPLPVKTHHHIDRGVEVGHEHPIAVLRRVEQLVLLRFVQLVGLRLPLVSQRHEPVGFPPSFRLVAKLALAVGIGARRSRPPRRPQLLYQSRGLLRRQHEPAPVLLIRLHRLPAVESRVRPGVHSLHRFRQRGEHAVQMMSNLFARRPVLCATPRPRTPSSPPETSGSADSSSSRGVLGYTPCALPSVGPYTVCTVVSVSSVTSFNPTWAASHTRCRICRPTSSSCRATARCSDAKNRQKVLCTGNSPTSRIPVSIGSRPRNCRWFNREKPTYNARIIANTNRKPGIDVVSRLIVTCCSIRSSNCSFSSIVTTGNKPP